MMQLAELWRLQETDIALDSRRASLDDASARLGETDELAELRQRVVELRAALRTARAAQKDIDLEADGLRAKIAPQEARLYSGAIKNPKELADLQADIDSLKRHLSAVEDRDLEALGDVESREAALRSAAGELTAMESAWTEDQAMLTARIETLSAEIAVYEREREAEAAGIDPQMLASYDRLRVAHQGRALARLERNLCTGCRISLPTNLVNRARAGTTLTQCPNCERILVA